MSERLCSKSDFVKKRRGYGERRTPKRLALFYPTTSRVGALTIKCQSKGEGTELCWLWTQHLRSTAAELALSGIRVFVSKRKHSPLPGN